MELGLLKAVKDGASRQTIHLFHRHFRQPSPVCDLLIVGGQVPEFRPILFNAIAAWLQIIV